ncbi:MAG TPA: glycine betaine ABC transporter substrate-binding protein, partial [Alphaproteobacteria bacterium]|nr:glycine betaine ABC transporter substrate-binding protein [Alphaproteobacteria bacterium]
TFDALRTGSIDLYPEYTGTGLVLLGLPGTPDHDRAFTVVSREFGNVGASVLGRLGFENTYSAIVTEQTAKRLGLESIHDLTEHAPGLRLAVTDDFARRPADGLQPFVNHFGLNFENTEIISLQARGELYNMLLDGRADVIIGFQTDPQIADYQLRVLDAQEEFFPAYDAVPVVARGALVQFPAIGLTLERLTGRLDERRMRDLNAEVIFNGRRPREVAREALLDLGLIAGRPDRYRPSINVAIDPWEAESAMAATILRAARETLPGRNISYREHVTPIASMLNHEARVAVAPSIAQFEISNGRAALRAGIETVAATGSFFAHVLARRDFQGSLATAKTIAAGPLGSPSYKFAKALAAWQNPPPKIISLSDTNAAAAVDAVTDDKADAAVVLATLERPDLVDALHGETGVKLLDADDWWIGAARLALPFLQRARIGGNVYEGMSEPVDVLAMQATVVGPAPPTFIVGRQGPSSYSEDVRPVTDSVVLEFNDNLGPHPDIGPHLPRAAALTPDLRRAEPTLNLQPGHTVLSVGILFYLIWCLWLFLRSGPARGETERD